MTIQQVLVATDLGPTSEAALTYGRALAQGLSARLHVVHVVDDLAAHDLALPASAGVIGLQSDMEMAAHAALQDLERDGATVAVLRSNTTAASILDYAKTAHADLIVVGTHGRNGFADLFMGSVAQQIVRKAECPVVTLRD